MPPANPPLRASAHSVPPPQTWTVQLRLEELETLVCHLGLDESTSWAIPGAASWRPSTPSGTPPTSPR
jgi:hypothetical protein